MTAKDSGMISQRESRDAVHVAFLFGMCAGVGFALMVILACLQWPAL